MLITIMFYVQFGPGTVDVADLADALDNVEKITIAVRGDKTSGRIRKLTVRVCRPGNTELIFFCFQC